MLRILIRFFIFVALMVGGAFFFAQWKLKDELKTFSNQVRPFMDFNYDSASLNLDGEIKINGIGMYIQSVGAHVEIRELKLFAGNLYQLAFMQTGLQSKKLPEKTYIKFKDVLLPFDSKLLVELNRNMETTSIDVLETAFCGPVERFGLDEYAAMGYSFLSFSGDMQYLLDKYDGSLGLSGSFDIEDVYYTDFNLKVSGVLSWYEEFTQQMSGKRNSSEMYITPDISSLEVNIKDQGFHLRKAEYCSRLEESKTDYYSGHVDEIESKLADVGMAVPEELKLFYRESIQPDSRVKWSLQPKINFEIKNIADYDYLQFVESSGLKVWVNDKPVNLITEGWSLEKISKIKKQAQQLKDQSALPPPSYQFTIVPQSFQKISLNSIDKYLQYRVKVKRDDGQIFEGRLTKLSRDKIWIMTHNKNGKLTLPFNRSEINTVEVYKETPKN